MSAPRAKADITSDCFWALCVIGSKTDLGRIQAAGAYFRVGVQIKVASVFKVEDGFVVSSIASP